MTSPLIEAMARAIKADMGRQFGAKPLGTLPTDDWHADGSELNLEEVAQAALKAISESGPTPEMIEAGAKCDRRMFEASSEEAAPEVFRVMIQAATYMQKKDMA